ncbi:MAG: conjugal transfer protein TraR [Desulfobacteraceae bacterium]|nr:conjugal transfer protein TraR [Desulfobacteraceae bacterium]
MNSEEKQKLKQIMHQKIQNLKQQVETFKNLSKPVSPDNAIGRLTRMEAINSKSINAASLEKAKQTLETLKHSVNRLDSPEFGMCNNCEEPIPFKRLLIMPESNLCVACVQKISENNSELY